MPCRPQPKAFFSAAPVAMRVATLSRICWATFAGAVEGEDGPWVRNVVAMLAKVQRRLKKVALRLIPVH